VRALSGVITDRALVKTGGLLGQGCKDEERARVRSERGNWAFSKKANRDLNWGKKVKGGRRGKGTRARGKKNFPQDGEQGRLGRWQRRRKMQVIPDPPKCAQRFLLAQPFMR